MSEKNFWAERFEAERGRLGAVAYRMLGSMAEAEDIANLIVFLCSEKASYMNGVSVDITGGKFCVQNPRFAWKFES